MTAAFFAESFADYAARPGVNASSLKRLAVSPLAYRWYIEHSDDGDTMSRRDLRANHCLVLEGPAAFDRQFNLFEGKKRAGKDYDAHVASHPHGQEALLQSGWDAAHAIAAAVQAHPVAGPLMARPHRSELTVVWTDEATGLLCKGRIDCLTSRDGPTGPLVIVDMKGVGEMDARQIGRQGEKLGWPLQLAHYRAGVRAAMPGRDVEVAILATQTKAPHDVAVLDVDAADLDAADIERRALLDLLVACRASGEWPGKYPMAVPYQRPDWAAPEMGDDNDSDEENHQPEDMP